MAGNLKNKYFVFNKKSDYQRGFGDNIKILTQGITIEEGEIQPGVFFSRIMDSKEKSMNWHRLCMDYFNTGDSSIHISVYASDSMWITWKDKEYSLEEIIQTQALTIQEKTQAMEHLEQVNTYAPKDILLHEVIGRYLWIRVQMVAQSDEIPNITGIKIMFPKNTWTKYLPEIYQSQSQSTYFLERFLGIYQSLYQDLTLDIERVAAYFDPDVASGEFLQWLATWMSIDDIPIWTEEQLSYLIKNAMNLYKIRGTKGYLSQLVELYTGSKPFIVEYHQTEKFRNQVDTSKKISDLYGDSPYVVTIVVDMNTISSNQQYKTLLQIVNHGKPAHMDSCVVVLRPYIFLDQHSYLGINSMLSQYRNVQLDGFTSLPFAAIEKK